MASVVAAAAAVADQLLNKRQRVKGGRTAESRLGLQGFSSWNQWRQQRWAAAGQSHVCSGHCWVCGGSPRGTTGVGPVMGKFAAGNSVRAISTVRHRLPLLVTAVGAAQDRRPSSDRCKRAVVQPLPPLLPPSLVPRGEPPQTHLTQVDKDKTRFLALAAL